MQQLWRPAPASVTRDQSGAMQLASGGYAYGLRVSQSCSFRTIVSHTGGLPGFGSIMQWLPDYGVGIVAFGNLTYTGWTRAVTNAFEELNKAGALTLRMPRPSQALLEMRDAASQLVVKWDDGLAEKIAAENLFLDQSKDRRRKALEDLHAQVGACRMPQSFDIVENALRGSWTMPCEKGPVQVSITLAPTMPPRVQFLSVRPGVPRPAATCGDGGR
jgi:hypothetical protein